MAGKKPLIPKRGDVFLVRLDPTMGAEIKKTRPAVIVQNNITNLYGALTIVAPITSHDHTASRYPTEVPLLAGYGGLKNDSVVLCGQVRTIDRGRLVKKLGSVSKNTLREIDAALVISLGIIEL